MNKKKKLVNKIIIQNEQRLSKKIKIILKKIIKIVKKIIEPNLLFPINKIIINLIIFKNNKKSLIQAYKIIKIFKISNLPYNIYMKMFY